MEKTKMGRVTVEAKIENLDDVVLVRKGHLKPEMLRSIQVPDALVDTAASTLSMPKKLIAQLGLIPVRQRTVRTSAGVTTVQMYDAVRLTVQGRDCICDVLEVPDECPVLIGQIPLENFDFVVDLTSQRLIGNPAHGGEQMFELY